jgi:ATP-binding cassette, subfamily B, bacterial
LQQRAFSYLAKVRSGSSSFSNWFAWPAIWQQWRRQRVPVVRQLTALECGAACLAMILNYFGRETSVAECREQCDVGRDGLTAKAIGAAARHYGLRVRAFSIQDVESLQHFQLPGIVHWNFNHFVVLEHFSANKVNIVDPALGRQQLTKEQFSKAFTGVILIFEPGIDFMRRRANNSPLWRTYLVHMLRLANTSSALVQILAASVLLQILGLALPVFTKILIDDVLPLQMTNLVTIMGVGFLLLFLTQLFTSYLRAALLIYLQGRLDLELMLGFFDHLLRLPFAFFHQRNSGDLLMRLASNATIREMLTNQTISTILDGGLVVVYFLILLTYAPAFGLIVLGIGTVQVAILLVTTKQMHSLTQQDLQAQAESQSYLVEALHGMATLKSSGAEEQAFGHWSNLFTNHLNISLRRSHFTAVVTTLTSSLRAFSPLLLLWIGALQVMNGRMSLGAMLALNALAGAFLAPFASLIATGQRLQMAGGHLERIMDVLQTEPEQDPGRGAKTAGPLTKQIEFRNISFRYHANAPWSLQNVSFKIAAGQKVAVVGPTGSGKSTLARLLLAFYLPTRGQIYYDGMPLDNLDYRTLRRQFGVVLQEAVLFTGSIRENITFNNQKASLADVVRAAQQAAVHDDILAMPMGYETVVAEAGNTLSGGQRQRLALARALIGAPSVLLLDEATSHLDAVTEARVHENLRNLACTCLVIAHRLSTIQDADLILVMNQGQIVEHGTHQNLIASDGFYKTLVHTQLEENRFPPIYSGRNGLTAAGR